LLIIYLLKKSILLFSKAVNYIELKKTVNMLTLLQKIFLFQIKAVIQES